MEYIEEIRFFSKPFYVILAIVIVIPFFLQPVPLVNVLPLAIIAGLLPLLFGRLLISVKGSFLRINFGYTKLIRKDIPLREIKEARVVQYRPLRQFGGWGIRSGNFEDKKTGCYSLKGNRGLLLTLDHNVRVCVVKTDRVIIGSEAPEKLRLSLKYLSSLPPGQVRGPACRLAPPPRNEDITNCDILHN